MGWPVSGVVRKKRLAESVGDLLSPRDLNTQQGGDLEAPAWVITALYCSTQACYRTRSPLAVVLPFALNSSELN